MHELTGFQRDLLFVVAGLDAPNGQDIKKELEISQNREILPGQVYSNLDALVEKGLVDKEKYDGRTNRYSITVSGEREIEALYEWQNAYISVERGIVN